MKTENRKLSLLKREGFSSIVCTDITTYGAYLGGISITNISFERDVLSEKEERVIQL